jgi:hypothetical protein
MSVYFSCPAFTVRLVLSGNVIWKAAPMAKRFEGQSVGDLASWAQSKYGAPISIETVSHHAAGVASRIV